MTDPILQFLLTPLGILTAIGVLILGIIIVIYIFVYIITRGFTQG